MSKVIFFESFPEFYNVLISLADKKGFENYFKGLENNLENCRVSADFSKITYEDLNEENGEYVHHNFDTDKAIYEDATVFTERSISKVLPHFKGEKSLKKCIGDLNIAVISVEEDDFYARFPLYKSVLVELRTILLNRLKIKENSDILSKDSATNKETKKELAAQLKWIYEIIKEESEHNEAVVKIKNTLRNDYSSVNIDHISWDDKKIYHISSEKINGLSCSKLMREIAIQLFGDGNAPGDQLIRDIYFK